MTLSASRGSATSSPTPPMSMWIGVHAKSYRRKSWEKPHLRSLLLLVWVTLQGLVTLTPWLGFPAWLWICLIPVDLPGIHWTLSWLWSLSPDLFCCPCLGSVGLQPLLGGLCPSPCPPAPSLSCRLTCLARPLARATPGHRKTIKNLCRSTSVQICAYIHDKNTQEIKPCFTGIVQVYPRFELVLFCLSCCFAVFLIYCCELQIHSWL